MPKRRREPTPVVFQKTFADLENELTRLLVEECKLHACVDVFLVGFYKILQDRYGTFPRNVRTAAVTNNNKRNQLLNALEEDINRLLSGFIESNTDFLSIGKVLDALRDRWSNLREDRTLMNGLEKKRNRSGDAGLNGFNKCLMELAHRQQSARLASIEEGGAQTVENAPNTLTDTALSGMYRNIRASLTKRTSSATFACGGSIPTNADTSSELNIFWVSPQDSTAKKKLVLPLNETSPRASPEALQELVHNCAPASFGRGRRNVHDARYRKAGKLDASQFTSSFELSNHGIMEKVEAKLLPQAKGKNKTSPHPRKLTAELYKLNVYSGPSGLFQKHVDTPQSENQIGSLVVCLPSPFKGGNLTVQHAGKETPFNWSKSSSTAIQWAEFYSDCEHEIKTVSEGERITLTYNRYVSGDDEAASAPSILLNPKSSSLYSDLKGVLQLPAFMMQGGVLGIYCSHAYPHASSNANKLFPRALKGSDLTVYSTLQSLKIETNILPILSMEEDVLYDDRSASYDHQCYLRDGVKLSLQYHEYPCFISMNDKRVDSRWKSLFASRQPMGLFETKKYARDHGLVVPGGAEVSISVQRVGYSLHSFSHTGRTEEFEDFTEIVRGEWPHQLVPISWINEPKHQEKAFNYIAYGNEPSIGTVYSYAAILALIPPFSERMTSMRS